MPREDVSFHWEDQQVVPATLGIAFGIKATAERGFATAVGEARVYRPGATVPEMWASDITELAARWPSSASTARTSW